MEGYSRKEEGCHQFLDLVPKERKCLIRREEEEEEEQRSHGCSEETKLELRLGPPTGDWTVHFPNNPFVKNPVLKPPWQQQLADKKALSTNVGGTSSAQKRTAPGPVVGWPPVRSFRKNLATGNSSKLATESAGVIPDKVCDRKPVENCLRKSKFVKINMDGIPIGRKVDLAAYDSYERLSYAVDELFQGLIAAQRDIKVDEKGGKATWSLVNENGEYTLVYEDNEGDRMLVGDVPWHMFVSTVKRLRVLRSSELSTLSRGKKTLELSF